jgi:hypothetical protein
LGVLLSLLSFARGETADSARDILLHQPDFRAKETMVDVESKIGGGMSTVSEIAKRDNTYWRDNGFFVFLSKPSGVRLRLSRKDKTYDELQATENERSLWYSGISDVEIFAAKKKIRFERVGTETVDGRNCLKIKANPDASAATSKEAVYFYAARDLKNLVIKVELQTSWRTTTYSLKDISFKVPETLFAVPADYKRGL